MNTMNQLINYNLENAAFYYSEIDVSIKSNITYVEVKKDTFDNIESIDIETENGSLNINRRSILKKVDKPFMKVLKFEWCFELRNQKGLKIGYIGKPKNYSNN